VDSNYSNEQIEFLNKRREFIKTLSGDALLPDEVSYIDEGKGSFAGCVGNLGILHREKADYAWFANHDLQDFKLQSYIATKLKFIRCKHVGEEGLMYEHEYFYALLSDYEPSIQWMSSQPLSTLTQKRVNNPAQEEYRSYQMTLALKGDWKQLAQRAEMFLSNPPAKMKKYVPDQSFYLALANGSKEGMEAALAEMTAPKVALKRNGDFHFAFAGQFIACFATLYAKIACRQGHTIELDTPFIPNEWLPVSPLEEYPDPYEFMRRYTVVA
jgi:hypothetical protein